MRLSLAFILVVLCFLPATAQKDTVVLMPVKVNGKWGYINKQGKIVISPKFDAAESFRTNKFAKVKLNGKASLINKKGDITTLPANAKVNVLIDNYLIVEQEGKFGVTDSSFNSIIPLAYKAVKYFYTYSWQKKPNTKINNPSKEYILAQTEDSLWFIYNFLGEKIIPKPYNYITKHDSLFIVANNHLKGAYNIKGEEILPLDFQEITIQRNQLITQKNGLWGYYNKKGKQLFSHKWKYIKVINSCWSLFQKKDSSFLINIKSRKRLDEQLFDEYLSSRGNELLVIVNDKRGLYNKNGEQVIPPIFDDFYARGNYYNTRNGNLYGLYHKSGREIAATNYDYIDDIENNIALVTINKKWGLINTLGEEVAPVIYDDIDLGDNTAKCTRGSKLKILTLNSKGKVVETVEYNNVVTLDINGATKWINPGRNTRNIGVTNRGKPSMGNWFFDAITKKWGLHNESGDTLIKPIFEKVTRTDTSLYTIVQLGKIKYTVNVAGYRVQVIGRLGLVEENTGKTILKPVMAYIDPIVLNSRGFSYARALQLSGEFLIFNGYGARRIPGCRFIDKQHEGISRAFVGVVSNIDKNKGGRAGISLQNLLRELHAKPAGKQKNVFTRDVHFKKGYWIYIDARGRKRNNKYEYADNFSNGRAIVKVKTGYSIINESFDRVVGSRFSNITYLSHSNKTKFLLEKYNTKEGYIDKLGNPTTGFNYLKVNNYSCGYGLVTYYDRFAKNIEKYYIDTLGRPLGGEKYSRAFNFNEDIALVRGSTRYKYIDVDGNIVADKVRKGSNFKNGKAWLRERGRYIILDEFGNIYKEQLFKKVTPFANNRAMVIRKGRKWEIIDEKGTTIAKSKFRRVKAYDELGNCIAAKRKKWGIVNSEGETIVSFKYNKIEGPINGKYILKKGSKKYYIYNALETDAKPEKLGKFYKISVLSNNRLVAHKAKETFVFSNNKKQLIAKGFIKPKLLYKDFCIVGRGSKMGVINYNGDTLLPAQYSSLKYLGNNLFHCENKDRALPGTIINLRGIIVVDKVSKANKYSEGLLTAMQSGKWGIIDENGIWTTEPKYNYIGNFKEGYARATIKKTTYVANINGAFINEANFEKLQYEYTSQLYRVEMGKRIGYLSPKGDWVWFPQQ